MAKAKKKAVLTLEERLEQALIAEAEQPYPVPGNWCWTTVGTIGEVKGGKRLPSGHNLVGYKTNHAYLRVTDFSETDIQLQNIKYITDTTFSKISNYTISKKDIYISIAGTIGRVGIIQDILDGSNLTENAAKITNLKINQKYLLWLLLSTNVQMQMGESTKTTTQAKLALFRIEEISIPISPLTEQQRIVDRIESLFAKLDEAKEKAQAALDSFETRKASILHKAFTGELTVKWRKENGVRLESWEEKNLQSACSMKITDGTHKTPTYCNANEGIPFISAKDVTSGQICWDNIKYIVPELHEELYARLAPEIDDILLAKNGTTGVAAIVNVAKVFDLYVTLALLRPNKNIINPRYLLNVINSPICKVQFDEHLTGIGVPNLHLRDIKEVLIPLPNLCEQAEIVRLLDNFFAKEQKAKELCSILDNIDLIKKSILARAFRGELGTNDPTEESALELLKSIV